MLKVTIILAVLVLVGLWAWHAHQDRVYKDCMITWSTSQATPPAWGPNFNTVMHDNHVTCSLQAYGHETPDHIFTRQ